MRKCVLAFFVVLVIPAIFAAGHGRHRAPNLQSEGNSMMGSISTMMDHFFNLFSDFHGDTTDFAAGHHHHGRPNIILLTVDDMGWADIGYHNPEVITPTMDDMAREGVILDHSYVQPACTPTRVSLMTGKYPLNVGGQHFVLGIDEPRCSLPKDVTVLPEAMKDLGYDSYGIGKWHLGYCKESCLPMQRGFDSWTGLYHGEGDHVTHTAKSQLTGIEGIDWHVNGANTNATWGVHSTDLIADAAINKIHSQDHSKPMFMYLAFQAPHSPSRSPEEYLELYEDIEDEERRAYLAMVTHLDDGIKRVKRALEETGMAENTLVVFLSDNGGRLRDAQYNYPLRGEKRSVLEGGTRTLGFLWGGVLRQHSTVYSGLLHASDWFPTFVSLAGGDPADYADKFDGVDQTAAVLSGEDSRRHEVVYNIDELTIPFQGAIRDEEGWKLIIGTTGAFGDGWPSPPESKFYSGSHYGAEVGMPSRPLNNYDYLFNPEWERRLYNLADDPGEHNNLFMEHPHIAERLEARINKHFIGLTPSTNVPRDPAAQDPAQFDGFLGPGWC